MQSSSEVSSVQNDVNRESGSPPPAEPQADDSRTPDPAEPQADDCATTSRAEPPTDSSWTPPSLPGLEFPGCTPRRMSYADLEAHDGRLEFWDARTATAWVCEPPVSPVHERPSRALAGLAERIATVRGSPVTCFGSMNLMVRDAASAPRRVMQADESLYLHPLTANLPDAEAMTVGEHDFPDVVLEVDHTTDARRGKLKLYEAWGFPEVWIQVPTAPSPSRRPKSRLPGLTIHLLEEGAYRVSEVGRAFPGWMAEEIHAALDETARSAETLAVLKRVGLTLGGREGTGPDDDPMARWLRGKARQGAIEQGLADQRELLRRLAERRFGGAAAAEFARRLEAETDPARLADMGVRIVDCATAEDLLETSHAGQE